MKEIVVVIVIAAVLIICAIVAFIIINRKSKSKTPLKPSPILNNDAKPTEKLNTSIGDNKQSEILTAQTEQHVSVKNTLNYSEDTPDEDDDNDSDSDDDVDEDSALGIVIKYSKSFPARLILAKDDTKKYYSILKNKLMSYKNVHSRISWKHETFNKGRKKLVKFTVRGKTLCIYFALDPEKLEGDKYKIQSVSDVNSHADTPTLYRIKNDRRCAYALELIEQVVQYVDTQPIEAEYVDYASQYPYEGIESLIEKGLVKVINTDTPEEPSQENDDGEIHIESQTDDEVIVNSYDTNLKTFVTVKYQRSYTADLIQASDETKNYYSLLKNYIISYLNITSQTSWKHELFKFGKNKLIKFQIKNNVLCLYLALDPKDYTDSKYNVEDVSGVSAHAGLGCLYKITNETRVDYAKRLILSVMKANSIERGYQKNKIDFTEQIAYLDDDVLIEQNYIKKIDQEIKQKESSDNVPSQKSDEVRISRSYTADLIQSSNETKQNYSNLKNYLMSFYNTTSAISWKHEIFKNGKTKIAKLQIKNNAIMLYLPIDPTKFTDTKYILEDVSGVSAHSGYSALYRVNSEARGNLAKKLIGDMMKEAQIPKTNRKKEDYAELLPYEDDRDLIERGLIKTSASDNSEAEE